MNTEQKNCFIAFIFFIENENKFTQTIIFLVKHYSSEDSELEGILLCTPGWQLHFSCFVAHDLKTKRQDTRSEIFNLVQNILF